MQNLTPTHSDALARALADVAAFCEQLPPSRAAQHAACKQASGARPLYYTPANSK